MALTLVKKTAEYKVFRRGDGRYAVQDAAGKPVNGEAKVKILVAEDLIKITASTAAPAEDSEATAEEAGEAETAADA